MNRTRSLKRNLTHRQCSRLATHFQERLEKLGIDWKPSGMPLIPPIEVIAFEKWDDETGMPDLLGNLRVTPHVHQIIDKRSLETAGLVRLKSNEVFCSISFDHVRICGAPLPYSRLFRVAIHEGAHVIYWLEQISRTGNKFSEADWRKFRRSSHGHDFRPIESELLHRAQDLGFRKRNVVPNEVDDLFDDITERPK